MGRPKQRSGAVSLAESRYNQHTWKCGLLYFVFRVAKSYGNAFPFPARQSPEVPVQEVLFFATVSGHFTADTEAVLMSLQVRSVSGLFHNGERGGVALTCTHGNKTCGFKRQVVGNS